VPCPMPVISNALGLQEMELTEGGECLMIDSVRSPGEHCRIR